MNNLKFVSALIQTNNNTFLFSLCKYHEPIIPIILHYIIPIILFIDWVWKNMGSPFYCITDWEDSTITTKELPKYRKITKEYDWLKVNSYFGKTTEVEGLRRG